MGKKYVVIKRHGKKCICIPVKTSYREYLYGDFDRDMVKNIDDPSPFDSSVKHYPEIHQHNKYFHKARYGGTEVKLSDELQAWEKYINDHRPFMKKFLHDEKPSYGRLKTIPSLMQKARKRFLPQIKDVAGVTLLTKNRREAYAKEKKIQHKYTYDITQKDDYYKKPQSGVHYGLHIGLISGTGRPMELQIMSKKMDKLNSEMHPFYKAGHIPRHYKKKGRRLFTEGY